MLFLDKKMVPLWPLIKLSFMDSTNNKIFLWNCRGAGSPAFFRYCKQFVEGYHPDIVVCMETRVDPQRLQNTFRMLGFDGYHFSPSHGFAGGIGVAWNSNNVGIQVEYVHFQFLHLLIVPKDGAEWYFTPVYASPREEARGHLWEELKRISTHLQGMWLVAGDFNDVAYAHEKKGGRATAHSKCATFLRRINDCRLLDLGSVGPRYTWKGPLFDGHSRIFERLDRALCNDAWQVGFPNAVTRVLPRVSFSDHHPIMVYPSGMNTGRNQKKFRFESAWMTHHSFKDTVKKGWSRGENCPKNWGALKRN